MFHKEMKEEGENKGGRKRKKVRPRIADTKLFEITLQYFPSITQN